MAIATINFVLSNIEAKMSEEGPLMLITGQTLLDLPTYNSIMDCWIYNDEFGIVVVSKCNPLATDDIAMVKCTITSIDAEPQFNHKGKKQFVTKLFMAISPEKYKFIVNDVDVDCGDKMNRQLGFKVDDDKVFSVQDEIRVI